LLTLREAAEVLRLAGLLDNVPPTLPSLRSHIGAAFRGTQFLIGDERAASVRTPLTIETNFSLEIPG
jgi:hypothetical protein